MSTPALQVQAQPDIYTNTSPLTQTGGCNARFSLLRQLHSTVLGEVVLCFDLQTQNYAIGKASKLDMGSLENPEAEVKMSQRFADSPYFPNVLQSSIVTFRNHRWLVCYQEFCGEDLFDFVFRQGTGAPAAYVQAIFRQLLCGVGEMHAQGVVHLDLKPENFLVRQEQDGSLRAFVCDLGQARATNQGYVHGMFGTAVYRAPEQGASSWFNGQAADMYSLGMTLHVLLTGTPLIDFAKPDRVRALRSLPQARLEQYLSGFSALDAAARSLIAGLLCNVPHDRLRMEQVLAHDWMTQSL